MLAGIDHLVADRFRFHNKGVTNRVTKSQSA